MDKRALSAMPRPTLTDKNKEMLLLVSHMCYLATADRLEINGADTLIINFFRAEEAGLKPAFRTFCQMNDYISQDLTTDKIKWKTGAINYLTGYLYWYGNSGNIVLSSVRERQEILGFFHDFRKKNGISEQQTDIPKGTGVDIEIERRIDEYQDTIKGWKLQRRHKKEKEVKKYIDKNCIARRQGDYFDYVKWIREMGYDMRNEFNLYPRDFKKAHDEKAIEYVRFQDKKAKEDMERFNKLLGKLRKETLDAEPMNLKIGGLFIRLPEKLDELKTEGEFLHHCVGTYRDKAARGETMIFFIRKEEEPDKPYYTLEWKGKVIQCRGCHNCDMTPEVKAFVNIFQEKMIEYENTPQKQRKAG